MKYSDIKFHCSLLAATGAYFIWSYIGNYDLFTWFLEALPVIIGFSIILLVYPRFKFTNLAYLLVFIHALILLTGAHYTYARVPAFDWIRDALGQSRNNFDRLGHFAQGFIPAILTREVLLRTSPLIRGKWLFFIVLSVCLAISAAYELIEWTVAITTADGAEDFLAMQGDIWDTQKDMAICLFGAFIALITLRKIHDRQLEKINA